MGKLLKKKIDFEVNAECANSGRTIEIALDSDLSISRVTPGAEPMFCFPIVQLAATESPGIVDIF